MKRFLPVLIALSMLLCSCAKSESARFSDLINAEYKEKILDDAFFFNSEISQKDKFSDEEISMELKKISVLSKEEAQQLYTEKLSALEQFNFDELSDDEKITYLILKREYEMKISGAEYALYDEILDENSGAHIALFNSLCDYKIEKESDAKAYLSLYADVGNYIDSIIEFEKNRAESGLFMTREDCETVIDDCIKISENPERMLIAFEKKVNALDIDESQKTALKEENKRLTKEVFSPSYKKLADNLSKLKSKCRANDYISSMPDGKGYYEHRLSKIYGKDISAKEVISMLDGDIERYESLFLSTAASFPEIFYEDNFGIEYGYASAEEIMPDFIKKGSEHFPLLDEFCPEISYTSILKAPVVTEDSGIDSTTPVKAKVSTVYPVPELFGCISSEIFPGKAYREWYFKKNAPDNMRIIFKNEAYEKGWEMYSQYEMNRIILGNKPSTTLLNSNSAFWTAVICRVDIGVNYEGWGEKEVDAFFEEHNISLTLSEYYYNLALQKPFLYMADFIGFHEIMSVKEEIKAIQGREFDEKAFNEMIMKSGSVPFDILKGSIN
ncbi:MAG: DUF885 family protein [Oscillospiraceae bacterium]